MNDFNREPTKEEIKKEDLEVKKILVDFNLAKILDKKVDNSYRSIIDKLKATMGEDLPYPYSKKEIGVEYYLSDLFFIYREEYKESWNWEYDTLSREILKKLIQAIRQPWWDGIYKEYIGDDKIKAETLYNKLKDIYTPSFETFTEENLKLLKELIVVTRSKLDFD